MAIHVSDKLNRFRLSTRRMTQKMLFINSFVCVCIIENSERSIEIQHVSPTYLTYGTFESGLVNVLLNVS